MDYVAYSEPSNPSINQWAKSINNQANAHGVHIPPCALAAIVERESGGNSSARSYDGGWGLAQITSGVNGAGIYTPNGMNMLDPSSNLFVAAKYFIRPALAECLVLRESHGDVMAQFSNEILFFAFCAFNAGFGEVERAIEQGYNPDEGTTNNYGAGTLQIYHRMIAASHKAGMQGENDGQ